MIEGLSFVAMAIGYLVLFVVAGGVAFLVGLGLSIFVLDTWYLSGRRK